jgi:hypothetical protein
VQAKLARQAAAATDGAKQVGDHAGALFRGGQSIQARLAVSAPDDPLEREADKIADLIVNNVRSPDRAIVKTASLRLQRQVTTFPPQEQPKHGAEKKEEEKEKLVEGGKKVAEEFLRRLLEGFSNSQTGKSILAANERDWKPISKFFEDFASTTVGRILFASAAAGAMTGAFFGARSAREESTTPSAAPDALSAPSVLKDEKFFSLELTGDLFSSLTDFKLQTPWLDLPPEISGSSSESSTSLPPIPQPFSPVLKIPRICTPADPTGDRGEAAARDARILSWLLWRQEQDKAWVKDILHRTLQPIGKVRTPGQPYGFGTSPTSPLQPLFKREDGAKESYDLQAIEIGLKSPSQPLDPETRAIMEPRFGEDFSGVRVHADSQAAKSASAVNALAYTLGQDVVFGAGRYQPRTVSGQRLLAHELAHTVQQLAAAVPDVDFGEGAIFAQQENNCAATQQATKPMPGSARTGANVSGVATDILQRVPATPESNLPSDRGPIVLSWGDGREAGVAEAGPASRPAPKLGEWPRKIPRDPGAKLSPEQEADVQALIELIRQNRAAISPRAMFRIAPGYQYTAAGEKKTGDPTQQAEASEYLNWLETALPDQVRKDPNNPQVVAQRELWSDIGGEGDPSAINAYDRMIVTWGRGFAGAQMHGWVQNFFSQDPAAAGQFFGAGIRYEGDQFTAVDLDARVVRQGNAALRIVQANPQLISLLVNTAQSKSTTDSGAERRQLVLNAQWKQFISHTGKIPPDALNWSREARGLAGHLIHGGDFTWSSFQATKGDLRKIVVVFARRKAKYLGGGILIVSDFWTDYVRRLAKGYAVRTLGQPVPWAEKTAQSMPAVEPLCGTPEDWAQECLESESEKLVSESPEQAGFEPGNVYFSERGATAYYVLPLD